MTKVRVTSDRGRWRARWQDDAGRTRSRSFDTRDEAEAFAAELRGTPADAGQPPTVGALGREWPAALGWAANLVLATMAREAGDPQALRASARALAQLAQATHGHLSDAETQEVLRKIQEQLADRRQAAKYGTRVSASGRSADDPPYLKPGDTIHG